MTPQQRSRDYLEKLGYMVDTVEHWKRFPDMKKPTCRLCENLPMIQIRSDLFGAYDMLALHPVKREMLFVQVTDSTSHSKRRSKLTQDHDVSLAVLKTLLAGVRVVIHSWGLNASRRYQLREEEITEEMLSPLASHRYNVEFKNENPQPDLYEKPVEEKF